MMAGYPWFRFYSEAVDDEKLKLLAFEDRWHFVALCCLKCSGVLDAGKHLERKIAVKLGLSLSELDMVKKRLLDVDLIDKNFQPLAWDKRQYRSDKSTERVRKYRESLKTGNVSGAFLKRPQIQIQKQIQNKEKKDKKETFLEYVKLTQAEHKKLVDRFGKGGAEERIENLNHYLGSKGKKYKSHYHTILSWEARDKKGKFDSSIFDEFARG